MLSSWILCGRECAASERLRQGEGMRMTRQVRIEIGEGRSVGGLFDAPPDARSCLVLAHGAGAGMTHPFMAAIADGLVARGVACLRYQFPYMEARSKRPDRPTIAVECVRSAVAAAIGLAAG